MPDADYSTRRTAIILAGGVAKGAFEAGAIESLSGTSLRICDIVATSSGALSGAFLAAAVRTGTVKSAAPRLTSLWRDSADWLHSFHLDIKDLFRGVAVSDSSKLVALLRTEIGAMQAPRVNPVRLKLVVGVMDGTDGNIGGERATTHEGVVGFDETSFESDADRERLYQTVAASAAFPIMFAPVEVAGLGACCDGGAVNDTPLKLAIDDGAECIIVIAPYPAVTAPLTRHGGPELLMRLVEVLTHERLYRDLHDAEVINASVRNLMRLVDDGKLSAGQVEEVLAIAGWREVEIITIRPDYELPGNSFSGLFDRALRESYIDAGRAAARDVIERHGWS